MKIIFDRKKQQAVALDEEKVIGICEFLEEKNIWNIIHTEVKASYQGQGIAKKLVLEVLESAKKEGKKVIADCSYAKKILEKESRETLDLK